MTHKTAGARRKAAGFASIAAAVCCAMGVAGAAAQGISDPTRPPAGMFTGGAGDADTAAGPVLQSVMITPTEKSAIIGGEHVRLGGKYGDARVVKITESEVVLRSGSGTETLRMYPDIGIKSTEPAPPGAKKPVKKSRGSANNTRGKQG